MSDFQEQTVDSVDFGTSSWQLIQWTIIAFLLLGFGYFYINQSSSSNISPLSTTKVNTATTVTATNVVTNSSPADANQNYIVIPAGSNAVATATTVSSTTTNNPLQTSIPAVTQMTTTSQVTASAAPAITQTNAAITSEVNLVSPAASVSANTTTHTLSITKHETLATVFKRYALTKQQVQAVLASGIAARQLRYLQPGTTLTLEVAGNQLQSLTYVLSDTATLQVNWVGDRFKSQLITVQPNSQVQYTGVVIENSLYHAIARSHLPARVAYQLEQIFSPEINFTKSIHPGDQLRIAYQQDFVKGKVIGHGTVVAAELIDRHHTYALIGYKNKYGDMEYYTPSGQSLNIAFLRTPLTYKYVSSPFSMHRFHPILGFVRPHLGVDLAAPSGTPVKASANSIVSFRGVEHGYGNTITLRYAGDTAYTMLYAHLSRFATGLRDGEYVKKGEVIGYVGQTGLATGPHLHYEVRINGVAYDPLTVALPNAPGLPASQYKAFETYARKIFASLNGVALT